MSITYRSPPGDCGIFSIRHLLPHFCLYSHRVVIFVGVVRSSFGERIFYLSENGNGCRLTGAAALPVGGPPSVWIFPKIQTKWRFNSVDADKKKIWIRGQFIEVTDEVYTALYERR